MNEAIMQSRFTRWIRENNYNKSAAFELKFCKEGKALSFKAFQDQQLPCLLQAKQACVYKKLSDMDMSLKPFDALQICNAEAWVIAGWHHEGSGIITYWVDIEVFLEAQKTCKKKSITEEQVALISSRVIHL